MNKRKKFLFFNLFMYVVCVVVLIVESSLNGSVSSSHSSNVGGVIAGIVNGATGDKAEIIYPTSASFENEVENVNVNDSITLKVKTLPEDSTYQSYLFTSSDEQVATIDNEGNVNFLKEGVVTLNATNKDHKTVECSTTITVNRVKATDLWLSLSYTSNGTKTYLEKENDVYTLTINQNYDLETVFYPSNTTYKNVTYQIPSGYESKISLDNNSIKVKSSLNSNVTIDVITDDIQKSFTITSKEIEVEYVELQAINISYNSYLSLGQSLTFTSYVKYVPANTSYKDVLITSSNPNVIKVAGSKITGVGEGSATIEVSSKHNPSISFSKVIEVKDVELTDFTIKLKSSMGFLYIGQQDSLIVSTYKPSNASYRYQSTKTYTSSDPSVLSISKTGVVKALKEGESTLTLKFDDNTYKSITIQVKDSAIIDDFTYQSNFTINQTDNIVYTDDTYTLSETLYIDKYYLNGNEVNIDNKTYTIKMDESIPLENYSLTSGKLNIKKEGKYTLHITHSLTQISKSYDFYAVNKLNLNIPSKLYVNEDVQINLPNTENLYYQVSIIDENNAIETTSLDKTLLSFVGINQGKAAIKLIPTLILDNETLVLDDLASIFEVEVAHIIATDFQVNILDNTTNQSYIISNFEGQYSFSMNVGQDYTLFPVIGNLATYTNFEYVSSDPSILEVRNGNLTAKKHGSCSITMTETESNISKVIYVYVTNIIKLDESKPYVISGRSIEFDNESKTYKITNGTSSRLKINFDESSTYKTVSYYSTNKNVLTIGKDGIITPVSLGTSNIIVTIDDGVSPGVKLTIQVEIVKKNLIDNLSSFFYKIRKGLGHFGAFLVLGIFSSMFYLTLLDKKKLLISIPLNIALGFGVAALTEFIQTFVPGRYGCMDDVMLDFSGFMCSAVLISLIYIIMFIVYIVKKNKKKVS